MNSGSLQASCITTKLNSRVNTVHPFCVLLLPAVILSLHVVHVLTGKDNEGLYRHADPQYFVVPCRILVVYVIVNRQL
jgi:hypothetical protein